MENRSHGCLQWREAGVCVQLQMEVTLLWRLKVALHELGRGGSIKAQAIAETTQTHTRSRQSQRRSACQWKDPIMYVVIYIQSQTPSIPLPPHYSVFAATRCSTNWVKRDHIPLIHMVLRNINMVQSQRIWSSLWIHKRDVHGMRNEDLKPK